MKHSILTTLFSRDFIKNSGLTRNDIATFAVIVANDELSREELQNLCNIKRRYLYEVLSKFKKLGLILNSKLPLVFNYSNIYIKTSIDTLGSENQKVQSECTFEEAPTKKVQSECTFTQTVPPSNSSPLTTPLLYLHNYRCNTKVKFIDLLKNINNYNIIYFYNKQLLSIKEKKENTTPFIPLLKEKKEMESKISQGEIDKKFDALLELIKSHNADIWRENFTRRYGVNPADVFDRFKNHVIGNCLTEELNQPQNKILAWIYNSAKSWVKQDFYQQKQQQTQAPKAKLGIGEFIQGGKRYYRWGSSIIEVPMEAPQRYDDRVVWKDGRWKFEAYN